MPSLDAFGGIQLSDQDAIESWLCAHKFRHQTYAYAASQAGVFTPPYDFTIYPDDDWFNRHTSAHLALQPFMVPDQSVSLTVLTQYTWDSDENFSAWMQMHTLIHQRLDQGLGIF
jgi:hypothetical protein